MSASSRPLKLGSNVYVKSPQRFISDCVSITGDITSIRTRKGVQWATLTAYVAKVGGGYPIEATFQVDEMGVRIGTPISQISTVPNTPGYSEWLRISRSWGYR